MPIGDPDVDWEETIYLNLIVHQLEYTITLAICSRTSPKDLQVRKAWLSEQVGVGGSRAGGFRLLITPDFVLAEIDAKTFSITHANFANDHIIVNEPSPAL